MFNFVPDDKRETAGDVEVPYFEEASADFAPYYASEKDEMGARGEVESELEKLGAFNVTFQGGRFMAGKQKRYGYYIRFQHRGAYGLIRVAGLPMKMTETPKKIERVRVQALLNVRDRLKAIVTSQVFAPGSDVLLPYLLVDKEKGVTMADMMGKYLESGKLPALSSSEDIVEGDFTERK